VRPARAISFLMPLAITMRLPRKDTLLRTYLAVSSVFMGAMLLGAFTGKGQKQRFGEIDVERINLVDTDGTLRMVLSNKQRSPASMLRGDQWGGFAGKRPGIIFYNGEGTEAAGLLVGIGRRSDGTYDGGGIFTFDQYNQDQTIALQYSDNNGVRQAGLGIADFPTQLTLKESIDLWRSIQRMPAGSAKDSAVADYDAHAQGKGRAYFGRRRDGASVVTLSDARGRVRLRLAVDTAGTARIDFLNDSGRVVRSLAP